MRNATLMIIHIINQMQSRETPMPPHTPNWVHRATDNVTIKINLSRLNLIKENAVDLLTEIDQYEVLTLNGMNELPLFTVGKVKIFIFVLQLKMFRNPE